VQIDESFQEELGFKLTLKEMLKKVEMLHGTLSFFFCKGTLKWLSCSLLHSPA